MEQLRQEIKRWIDDTKRDHFKGIKLLSQVSANRMLIRNLSKSDKKYFQDKLLSELKRITFSANFPAHQIESYPKKHEAVNEGIVDPPAGNGETSIEDNE